MKIDIIYGGNYSYPHRMLSYRITVKSNQVLIYWISLVTSIPVIYSFLILL